MQTTEQDFRDLVATKRAELLKKGTAAYWREHLRTAFTPVHDLIAAMDNAIRKDFGAPCGVTVSIGNPTPHRAYLTIVTHTPKDEKKISLEILDDHIGSLSLGPHSWIATVTPRDCTKLCDDLKGIVAEIFKNFPPKGRH